MSSTLTGATVHQQALTRSPDWQALGFALLETVLGALTQGSREKTQQEALQRLVGVVFHQDMAAFR